jgi:hypothetical protein
MLRNKLYRSIYYLINGKREGKRQKVKKVTKEIKITGTKNKREK